MGHQQSSVHQNKNSFRKNVNLQEQFLETGVQKIPYSVQVVNPSDDDQDRLSSSNFKDLLLELTITRQTYKHDIEKLASLRMQSHENFQQLFEDKLEYVEISTFCKCKKSIRAKHDFTTTEFKQENAIKMQKLLQSKVKHMGEELPLS